MKTAIRNLALAGLLAFGMNVYATDLNVSIKDSNTVTVSYANVMHEAVLSVEDELGFIVYREELKTLPYFRKSISLDNLPAGSYYLRYEDKFGLRTTHLIKTSNGTEVAAAEEAFVFKPAYKKEGELLLMSLTNPTEKETVTRIYDASGNLVGTAKSTELIVKKTFDFSEAKPGTYLINVHVGGHSFSERFTID